MTEYYLDLKEDGKIDQLRFKDYDPFFESPDTPTQIGTANVCLMSLGHMIPIQDDFKILNSKSKNAGLINVEIVPCQDNGTPITNQIVRNPARELANKKVNFAVKINMAKNLKSIYEVKIEIFNI